MNIHQRLKYLREELNLTTRAFGAAINMSGGAITNMEKRTRNITERTVRDICREYAVHPEWFLHGTGSVFVDVISRLDIDEEVKQYSMLNDADREIVQKIIRSLAEKAEKG